MLHGDTVMVSREFIDLCSILIPWSNNCSTGLKKWTYLKKMFTMSFFSTKQKVIHEKFCVNRFTFEHIWKCSRPVRLFTVKIKIGKIQNKASAMSPHSLITQQSEQQPFTKVMTASVFLGVLTQSLRSLFYFWEMVRYCWKGNAPTQTGTCMNGKQFSQ